jgi:hypothetical protein
VPEGIQSAQPCFSAIGDSNIVLAAASPLPQSTLMRDLIAMPTQTADVRSRGRRTDDERAAGHGDQSFGQLSDTGWA